MSYYFSGRYYKKNKPFFTYSYKDYSFKVDLEFGDLLFSRHLVSFSGELPIDLKLQYVQLHAADNHYFHTQTLFPRGFKTNYHIFLEYNSYINEYFLEDADGFMHEFKRSTGAPPIYYDSFGSGLFLIAVNNGFKVSDFDGNYQLFDQYGRLITIHKKISASHDAEIHISYSNNTSLAISSITDSDSRTISFLYTSAAILILFNNNLVAVLQTSNNLLTKVAKNNGASLIEDSFSYSSFVNSISLGNDVFFNLDYDLSQVIVFQTNRKQDVFSFEYYQSLNKTVVTNARNISTIYDFNQDQSYFQTENNSNPLSYCTINSDITSCLIKDDSSDNQITRFYFFNGNVIQDHIDVSGNSTGYSLLATNNNLQSKRMYLFYAQIEGNIINQSFQIQLFDNDSHLLADLFFKDKSTMLSFPVGIRESSAREFYIKYTNGSSNTVTIKVARLIPLLGDFEAITINADIGGPVFFYGDEAHYLLSTCGLEIIDNSNVLSSNSVVTSSDFLKNEKLFYKSGTTSFSFVFNDQKTLVSAATSVYLLTKNNLHIGFNSSLGMICLYSNTSNPNVYIQQISFSRIKGSDNNSFSFTRLSHQSSSFHYGYTSYYYEEKETKYIAGNSGVITYYDYDENYRLNELNRNDGYKEVYSYDPNGNQISQTITHSDLSKKILNNYSYDSSNRLISQSSLVASSISQTGFSYDSFGNVNKTTYPSNLEKNSLYDSISGERKVGISYQNNNNVLIEQNNNYIDEDSSSLSSGGNTFLFQNQDGSLISVSYNEEQIVAYTYYSEIYSGYPLHNRYVAFYLNGYYAHTVYDAFDRVLSKEGLIYTYDDLSNVTNIYDDTSGGYLPNTDYTYNYYNELSKVEVDRGALSLDFVYDNYRRLVSQTYQANNNDIYTLSFTYFTNYDLQNTIKKTSLNYGLSSLEITDALDAFHRLKSQSFGFGSVAKTFNYTYFTGGANNAQTNKLVKTTYYTENINNSNVIISKTYAYDALGNIISITHKEGSTVLYVIDYVYDILSRLIRENNPLLNKTYTYSYDSNGNILAKTEYAYSTSQTLSNPIVSISYSYHQTYPNRLTSYGSQQNLNAYDSVGNPTLYRDKTMSWVKGTLLSEVIDGNTTINLTYDGFKQRIAKSVNNVITNYFYINNQLLIEQKGNQTLTYLYSHHGITGFIYNNVIYYYEKNIQQDIIAIRNANHYVVASYAYDAWGNHVVYDSTGAIDTSPSSIGNINPFRYRSYYYDTDLKMYWLTTRYYDPEVGRFISPDSYTYLDYQKLHGINLYAYSKNNPAMYYDPSGHFLTLIRLAYTTASAVGALAIVAGSILFAITLLKEGTKNSAGKIENGHGDPYLMYHGNGFDLEYYVDKTNAKNEDEYILRVRDSWKYSQDEINEFLSDLQSREEVSYPNLNVDKVRNEWIWHNLGYFFPIPLYKKQCSEADIYLNSDDKDHGLFSWIINNLRWW